MGWVACGNLYSYRHKRFTCRPAELSEVQKMTPRERMRVRKVQAADEEARKLK